MGSCRKGGRIVIPGPWSSDPRIKAANAGARRINEMPAATIPIAIAILFAVERVVFSDL